MATIGKPVALDDIIIITPYSAHVTEALPAQVQSIATILLRGDEIWTRS